MSYKLLFTDQANDDLNSLEQNPHLKKRLKAVRKALGYLETNPKHPGLNTHKFSSLEGAHGEEVLKHMPKTTLQQPIEFFGIMARIKKISRSLQLPHILEVYFFVTCQFAAAS
jgi:hypothetical protein